MTADDFVNMHREEFPVAVLCAAIGHRRSTYYARRGKRRGSVREERDRILARQIAKVRTGHNRSRGRRNVREALSRKGQRVSERRIGRVMRAEGWYGAPRSFRRPPVPAQLLAPSDLVQRQFRASAPNRVWWTDVTEIPTARGVLYLAAIQDAFSRCIVGYALARNNDTELVLRALNRAARTRRPPRGLIHHSDQGSPYRSWTYQSRLAQLGAVPSMGRVHSPHDNACMESWNSTLERELLAINSFKTGTDAESAVASWIRHFNRQRFHSTLGRLTPAEFEAHHA